MKLFKISQTANMGYDVYDSAVVCAEDEEQARRTHPRGPEHFFVNDEGHWVGLTDSFGADGQKVKTIAKWKDTDDWTLPENVSVEYLGEAREGMPPCAICASFNAG